MRCLVALACLIGLVVCDNWVVMVDHLGVVNGANFFNATHGLAVGLQAIHRTTDAGKTWERMYTGDSVQTTRYQDVAVSGSFAVSAGIGDSSWIPGSSWSSNWGVNWTRTDETHLRQQWFSVDPVPGHPGYFIKCGQWTDVLRTGNGIASSANGGASWTDHDWTVDTPARFSSWISSSVGWVAGGESPYIWNTNRTRAVIAKTTDGGWNWVKLTDVSSDYYHNGISFADSNNGWVIGVRPTESFIMKTTDGGSTWKTQVTLPNVKLQNIKMFSATEGFAVGGYEEGAFYHGQLLHTTDGGQSWISTAMRGYIFNNIDGFDNKHVYATAEAEQGGGVVLQYLPA